MCQFCNKEIILREEVFRNNSCIFLSSDGYNPPGVLNGAGVIIPIAHKETVFDLSENEIKDAFDLLQKAKDYIDMNHSPDGYTVGWNNGTVSGQSIFHAHMHVLPRYHDEPMAGKGIRHFLKQETNRRNWNIE